MDLNFFSGMDRETFEKGLKPVPEGYIPQKNEILIYEYDIGKKAYDTFYIFTNFVDGTNEKGWGIFYDIYDVVFGKGKGIDILSGYGGEFNSSYYGIISRKISRRVEAHPYQWPNIYISWLRNSNAHIWEGKSKMFLNWNENPLEVKQ